MRNEWNSAPLMELYDAFVGVTKSRAQFGEGVPMLDFKTILHSPFVPQQLGGCAQVEPGELEKYSVRQGDIFLNRTSESAAQLALSCVADEDRPGTVFTGFAKRLRPRPRCPVEARYMAGFLRSRAFRRQVAGAVTAYTTRASLDNQALARLTVYYPSRPVQKRLGDLLHTLWAKRRAQEALTGALQREIAMLESQTHPQDARPFVQQMLGESEARQRAQLSGLLQQKQMLPDAQARDLEALWDDLIEQEISLPVQTLFFSGDAPSKS